MNKQIGKSVEILAETNYKGLCEHYLPVEIENCSMKPGNYYSVQLNSIYKSGTYKGLVNGII